METSTYAPLTGHQSVGTVVHLGAGRCSELPRYLESSPYSIILVEPQPDFAKMLRKEVEGLDSVSVIEAAVSGQDLESSFKVLNMRCMSGLRVPTGLCEMYPGLRIEQEVNVEVIAAREIFEEVRLSQERANWLIIDAPGVEGSIIAELGDSGLLEAFEWIDLRCGKQSQYEGSVDAKSALKALVGYGYRVDGGGSSLRPQQEHWWLQLDRSALESQRLRGRVSELEKEREELMSRLEEVGAALEGEVRARKKALEERERAQVDVKYLEAEKRELERDVKRLSTKADQAHNEAQRYLERITELENENSEVNSALEVARHEVNQAQMQCEAIREMFDGQPAG